MGGVITTHLKKFTQAQSERLLQHCERTASPAPNIDPDRTGLNYSLAPEREQRPGEYLTQRLGEVRVQHRKDVKTLCSWVCTVPKDFQREHPDRLEDFFRGAYDFLADRYGGEKNIVSAVVHMDETTPHLHFVFCPVVVRDGRERLSAKDTITRSDLRTIHGQAQDFLRERLKVPDLRLVSDEVLEGRPGQSKSLTRLRGEEELFGLDCDVLVAQRDAREADQALQKAEQRLFDALEREKAAAARLERLRASVRDLGEEYSRLSVFHGMSGREVLDYLRRLVAPEREQKEQSRGRSRSR